jgi:hypothetical protein
MEKKTTPDPGLRVVDGRTLDPARRALLRPGELVTDVRDHRHALPRFFYEIESWEQAKDTPLAPHFTLAELITVDCREAPLLLEEFPHYVPCAVSVLARYLEAFRQRVDAPVFIAANGGYRSPAHALCQPPGPHAWASAANIYRVGDRWLDDRESIEKYARLAESIAPELFAKPFGSGFGETDDHLHFDIGYVTFVPRDCDEAP